jgi:A/G-specific adenine glycosylase
VGLYTASAVLSICRDEPLPVVDGNVRRVLARLQALAGPAWRGDAAFYNRAEELLDRDAPGDWNQALMELGATVCTPKRPACAACPLRSDCRAFAEGLQERLPERRGRRAPVDVTLLVALIERDGSVLLARRPEGKLLGRMWELPQTPLEPDEPPDLAVSVRERYGLAIRQGELLARARHAITFRRIRVEGYAARLLGRAPAEGDRFRWIDPSRPLELPVSSLTRKLLGSLGDPQKPLPLGE